ASACRECRCAGPNLTELGAAPTCTGPRSPSPGRVPASTCAAKRKHSRSLAADSRVLLASLNLTPQPLTSRFLPDADSSNVNLRTNTLLALSKKTSQRSPGWCVSSQCWSIWSSVTSRYSVLTRVSQVG